MINHSAYMSRCIELARQGAGYVAPNPMVGAVLVYNDHIIGEGWHQQYGGPHAEVNCILSVKKEWRKYISRSTLYVSLEPCAHFGKTPPCADLIIENKIPKVVIGCRDPFKEVNGKGIEKLHSAGVEVESGILENECRNLNKRFFIFHTQQRPYIVLKWAETADKKIAAAGSERLFISNEISNRLVHKWRSEEASILVGTNTALMDNPELTTRFWSGSSPVRLVVDMDLKLPLSLNLLNEKSRTVIFNTIKQEEKVCLQYYQVKKESNLVQQMVDALYHMKLNSVLVEGGAQLLQSFIDEDLWDEIRVIRNEKLNVKDGLNAPVFKNGKAIDEMRIADDLVSVYYH